MEASSTWLRVVWVATIASFAALGLSSLLYLVGGDGTRSARLIILIVGWIALSVAAFGRWRIKRRGHSATSEP